MITVADCREWLRAMPDKSVDHVITDPPYEAECHADHGLRRRSRRDGTVACYALIDFDKISDDLRATVSSEIARVSRGWVLVFCQIEAVALWRDSLVVAGAKYKTTCTWVKPDGAPRFTGDAPARGVECLVCAWAGTGHSKWNGGGRRGVFTHNVQVNGGMPNEHPTTKPLSLMMELVSLFTNPGEVVIDPFAGSGSTGVACLRLGRQFAGCERDPDYARLAKERISAEQNGTTVRACRAGQTPMFPSRRSA